MKLNKIVAIMLSIAGPWSSAYAAGECVKFKKFIAAQIAEGTYAYKELTVKSSPDRIWTEEKCQIEVTTKLNDTISLGTFNENGYIACQAVYQVVETSSGRSYDIKSTPFAVVVSDSGKPLEALFAEVPIDDLRSAMKQQYRPEPFTIKLHNEGVGSFGSDLNCRANSEPFPSAKIPPSVKQSPVKNQKVSPATVEGINDICKGLDLAVDSDQAECLNRKLSVSDASLNTSYKSVMANLNDQQKNTLKMSQRTWVKEKIANCNKAGNEFKGGTMETVAIADCNLQVTDRRVIFLKNYRP